MIRPPPRYCEPRAYACFAEQVAALGDTEALVGAAVAISMHALEDVHIGAVVERLEALAVAVRRRLQSESRQAMMAHLHHVLFEQERFAGNRLDYYDPDNSYLPRVLATRRGIPITLSLIYKAVAERVGLAVDGIGAPGHYLVRVEDDAGPLLVDPFHGGRVLSDEDAYQVMEGALGAAVPREPALLKPTTDTEWLARILRNLEAIYTRRAQPRDAAAMAELRRLLPRGSA